MPQPLNYSGAIPDPSQGFLGGLKTGAAIQGLQQQQQMQQLQLQQAQTDAAARAQMASDLQSASGDISKIPALMVKYPQLADKLKMGWDTMNSDMQRSTLQHTGEVLSAVQAGRPDIATQILKDRATAQRNSGDTKGADTSEAMANWIDTDPKSFATATALRLAAIPEGQKMLTSITGYNADQRDQALAPAKVRQANAEADIKTAEAGNAPTKFALENSNVRSQIAERAGRLALDQDKLRSEVELKLEELRQKNNTLDPDARKLVNDSAIAAVAADQSSTQMLSLADRLEQSAASSGLAARGAEAWKSLTGNQDAITQLRQEYTRLRSTQVTKMLPPGPASDKDIQLAMAGFPADTADAKTMATFVRGMAKLSQYEGALNSAKAEWVNAVGTLGKPKTDIEVDGVKVPAGTNFADFAAQFMSRNADKRAQAAQAQQLQGRSYMRWANPTAPAAAPAPGQMGSGTFGVQ